MATKLARLATTTAAAAMLAGLPAAANAEFRLGALVPVTGDLQVFGETSSNGIDLAVQQINDAGGVHGEPVEVVTSDTQALPQAGVSAAQSLVNVEGVHAIVGALSSGVTIPVARSVTSEAGVPQISNASTSPVITDLADNDFLFRTTPSDALQGQYLADLVREEGVTDVSVIYVNNDYGQGLNDTFVEHYEGDGHTVHQSIAYEQGQGSYRGEVQRAARGDATHLLLIGYPQYGNVILRQAIEGGHFQDFIFTDGMKSSSVAETIGGQFLNGSFGTAPVSRDTDEAATFDELYEAEYGERPPQPFIDTAYDAAMILSLAAQSADELARTAIRDQIREVANPPGTEVGPGDAEQALSLLAEGEDINYQGAAGPQNFDENGDIEGFIGHWVFENEEVNELGLLN